MHVWFHTGLKCSNLFLECEIVVRVSLGTTQARLYVDDHCILHDKPLMDSATTGVYVCICVLVCM